MNKEQWKARYHAYLQTEEWKGIVKKVRKRANYRCEECGETCGPFHCHHVHYRLIYREYLDLSCLKYYCEYCHQQAHGIKGRTFKDIEKCVVAWCREDLVQPAPQKEPPKPQLEFMGTDAEWEAFQIELEEISRAFEWVSMKQTICNEIDNSL